MGRTDPCVVECGRRSPVTQLPLSLPLRYVCTCSLAPPSSFSQTQPQKRLPAPTWIERESHITSRIVPA